MPTTYTKPEPIDTIKDQVQTCIEMYHPDLLEAKLKLEVLYAWNDEDFPLKQKGYPCMALIKVNSLKDRACGCADTRLVIDGRRWEEMDEPEQMALLDHELTHLVPKRKEGRIVTDDLKRPKLGTRPHDFELAGFYEVCKRHRKAAGEVLQVHRLADKFVQLDLYTLWPEMEHAGA